MSIFSKVKPIEVNDKNPHEHDALDRERDCLFLVDLIEESDTPFTLAVDAEWGNGKTVFIKMLQAHLKEKGFRCVFFNAWECDFYSEPLAPLIAEISRQIPSDSSIGKIFQEKGPGLLKCFKDAASLAHPLAPVIIKILETGFDSIKTESLSSIKDYEHYRSTLEDFKKSIGNFSSESKDGKPLVVLIDDLDRCRPDFAINTLERVKHIFDVPSLFFVVSVNKKEFGNVVKSFYGCGDGERYLEKFFDLVFHLRNEKTLINLSLAKVEFDSFRKKIDLLTDNRLQFDKDDYREWFTKYLESISKVFQFTLRVQEKFAMMLSIALKTVDYKFICKNLPEGDWPHSESFWAISFRCPILCYFLALRIANPDLFNRSIQNETIELFPWEEHIKFYFLKSGVQRKPDVPGVVNLSSLEDLKPEESNLICLSLIALATSWGNNPFTLDSHTIEHQQKKQAEMKGINQRTGIDNYSSFREFLKAVDFAGRFYESEGGLEEKRLN